MTKAAASAARAQPAEWCDRKYDKHLSYSATWGRSAGRAGSRGVGVGAKHPTPRRGVHAAAGLSRGESREGASGRGRRWGTQSPKTPQNSRATREDIPTAGWGLPLEPGENMPLVRGGLGQALEMGRQVNSTSRAGRKDRVASSVPGCAAGQTRQPAATGPERVHEGGEARLADRQTQGGQRLQSSAQKFHVLSSVLSVGKLLRGTTYI